MTLTLNLQRPLQGQQPIKTMTADTPPPSPPVIPLKQMEQKQGGSAPTINGRTLTDILSGVDLKKKVQVPKNNIKFIF